MSTNVAAPSYGANAGILATQGAAATDALEGKVNFAATAYVGIWADIIEVGEGLKPSPTKKVKKKLLKFNKI